MAEVNGKSLMNKENAMQMVGHHLDGYHFNLRVVSGDA